MHICPLLSFSSACLFKCWGEHKNIRPGPGPDIGTRLLSKEKVRSKKANVCVSLYMLLHMCVRVCVCVVISGVVSDDDWYLELTFLILGSR